MSKNVTIKTSTVGQSFATCAVVTSGRRRLHVTDNYPYGFEAAARAAAEAWCEKHGLSVQVAEGARQ